MVWQAEIPPSIPAWVPPVLGTPPDPGTPPVAEPPPAPPVVVVPPVLILPPEPPSQEQMHDVPWQLRTMQFDRPPHRIWVPPVPGMPPVLVAPSELVVPPVALPPRPGFPSTAADVEPSTPADPAVLPPAPPVRPGVPPAAGASSALPPPAPPVAVPPLPPELPLALAGASDLLAPLSVDKLGVDFPHPATARNTPVTVPISTLFIRIGRLGEKYRSKKAKGPTFEAKRCGCGGRGRCGGSATHHRALPLARRSGAAMC